MVEKKKPANVAAGASAPEKKQPAKSIAAAEEGHRRKTRMGDEVLVEVPVESIKIIKGFNPRSNVGDVAALASLIKQHGLVHDILVAPTSADKPSGSYDLISGERRLSAIKSLGYKTVSAKVRIDLAGREPEVMLTRKAVAVAENDEEGRTNLNAVEQGRVFADLRDNGKWSVEQIAKQTGVHQRRIRRCLDLMAAPNDILAKVETGEIGMRAGIEIAKLDDATRKAIKKSLGAGVTEEEVKRLAKAAAKEGGAAPAHGKGTTRLKGATRAATQYAWRGALAKGALLKEIAHYLHEMKGDQVGTTVYHELRGIAATLFWDRGDLERPYLPNLNPDEDPNSTDPKGEKALNAHFMGLVKAEAGKFTPPKEEGEEDAKE
jgi:ParB/RepB/Spo0J family partition protein